ncbi:metalloprotease TIKI2-like protein [Lates japonicus]|uniref:Metalloprotease TIKI2-like protein n=1 Tax=Lates japonicus TaxID=270547 RepID=A0AAD3MA72_LATJO|nr:metalloprotease TIKI2-like protein [Lates japonicus]
MRMRSEALRRNVTLKRSYYVLPLLQVKTLQTCGAHRGNSPKRFFFSAPAAEDRTELKNRETGKSFRNQEVGRESERRRRRKGQREESIKERRENSSGSRLSQVSKKCHLDTMVCLPGFSWVFLCALLHAVAPWGAERRDRPRQCDAPKSQSDMNSFLWRVKRAPPKYFLFMVPA